MTRRQAVKSAAIGAAVALAVVVLVLVRRRQAQTPQVPAWLDIRQPPDAIPSAAGLTADQSWAANRCRPFAASSGDHTAGRRVRRTYPASLAESPHSFIRTSFELEGGV